MSVLVAYATGSGCSQWVAQTLAHSLAARGISAVARDIASDPDPADFDAVVAGSGARHEAWHPHALAWLELNIDDLRAKLAGAFTVCLAMKDPANLEYVVGYTEPMLRRLSLQPIEITAFAGWNIPDRFTAKERKFMENKEAGDWRNAEDVDSWAPALVSALRSGPTTSL